MKSNVTVEKDKMRVDNDSMRFLQKVTVFTMGTIAFSFTSIKEPDFVGKKRNGQIIISLTKGCLVVTSVLGVSAPKAQLGEGMGHNGSFFFEPHSNIVHIEEGGVSKVESEPSLSITNQEVTDLQGSMTLK